MVRSKQSGRRQRRFAILRLLGTTLLITGAYGSASGQILPYGPEFQVNSYTPSSQVSPRVAEQAGGGFAIVWSRGNSGDEPPVVARRLDSNGLPVTDEVIVSEHSPDLPTGLASDREGNLVVTWGSGVLGPGGGFPANIEARRLSADLVPLGSQFVVNGGGPSIWLGGGRVARQPGGRFLVVWENWGGWARAYDAAGSPLGASFVLPDNTGQSTYPSIAPLPAGEFLVAWREVSGPGDSQLLARRFDSQGDPVGEVISIAGSSEAPWNVRVASHSSGAFVAAWNSSTGGEEHVRARRFAADGSGLGGSFQVDAGLADERSLDGIVIEGDGNFVIAWRALSYDGGERYWDLVARRYAPEGVPLGAPYSLNSYTTGSQLSAELAVLENGDLVVTWSSSGSTGDDDDGSSIQARRFRVPFFMDGFESADTSRWSKSGT